VHQVQVEVVEAGISRPLHRGLGLAAVVDAPQPAQAAVIEALDAEAQPVHARGQVALEAPVLGRAGIGFQGDLAAGDQLQPRAGALERSEEHTSELQSRENLVCRLLLEKKKKTAT